VPEKTFHLNKKDSNVQTRDFLKTANQFYDWEITTLFYSALHFVDAFFADLANPSQRHPKSHGFRRKMVNRYLGSVALSYGLLNDLSENARYEEFTPDASDVEKAEKWFNEIADFVGKIEKA
jgi:hypothetical protein